MNNFNAALRDIQRALGNGYPPHLAYKLLERKAKCLLKLGLITEAKEAFHEAIAGVTKHIKDADKKSILVSSMSKLLETCQISSQKKTCSSSDILESKCQFELQKMVGANPKMPALSNAINIAYAPQVNKIVPLLF